MRDKGLGYGEIAITLSLAEQIPGGINDANVNKILDQRLGEHKMGWGQIAKEDGVKLGQVVSKLARLHQKLKRLFFESF